MINYDATNTNMSADIEFAERYIEIRSTRWAPQISPEPTGGVGACADTDDPDLFFSGKEQDQARAQEICNFCEIRRECLQQAIRTGQTFGVWGGQVFK